jgi:hypothetical protein
VKEMRMTLGEGMFAAEAQRTRRRRRGLRDSLDVEWKL